MNERPRTRLFVEETLGEAGTVRLTDERAHFLRNVLRLEAGAVVALFNGRDGEWLARIDTVAKSSVALSLTARTRDQQPAADLWVLFAPIKHGRIDSIAEKATELGASVLWPVFTRYTDAQRVNDTRLRANAVEAAEQCERLDVPDVRAPIPLDRVLADWPEDRPLFLCAEAGIARPIAEAVRDHAGKPAAFLIGPEGGFAETELDELRKRPFVVPVGLGPRILRADTAVFAALACWQSLAGDWVRDGTDRRPRALS